ncbi:Thioredoxin [Desulfonema limicola]|uniref:Thioredoxin n=1 Tax=Desulfonema limicola TaxID=45656 RepID=A0A975B6I1_9BACT|nr:thioredoxin family protein [Desulfonema limicola]QTA79674.1 Thioredoxin [Desulfonema limicola]
MKQKIAVLIVSALICITSMVWADSSQPVEVPVKDMVTMVDLGAKKCIPCKMMAPILEKMEKEYKGRAAIVFLDVWQDPAPAKRFNIRAIPTQIFFDKDGNEYYRHTGFMDEKSIAAMLKKMGVE